MGAYMHSALPKMKKIRKYIKNERSFTDKKSKWKAYRWWDFNGSFVVIYYTIMVGKPAYNQNVMRHKPWY